MTTFLHFTECQFKIPFIGFKVIRCVLSQMSCLRDAWEIVLHSVMPRLFICLEFHHKSYTQHRHCQHSHSTFIPCTTKTKHRCLDTRNGTGTRGKKRNVGRMKAEYYFIMASGQGLCDVVGMCFFQGR